MSDLTATHCGCNESPSNGCGSFIWIIILLFCCGGNGGGIGGGCGGGCNSGCNSGCGNGSGCDSIFLILILLCCGGNGSFC